MGKSKPNWVGGSQQSQLEGMSRARELQQWVEGGRVGRDPRLSGAGSFAGRKAKGPGRGSGSGGGGGGGGGGGSPSSAPRTSTYGEADPTLKRQAARVEERLGDKGEAGLKRRSERDIGLLRDLGTGQSRALASRSAKLGTLGKGSGTEMGQRDIDAGVQRGAADIMTRNRESNEASYDNLLIGSTGALGAPGQSAMDAARFASGEQGRVDATALQRESLKLQREMMEAEKERAELDDWFRQMDWALA